MGERVELRQLQYFLTVAEELHFGRAAARLHIVQSAVSQQIRRLERELGLSLFERTTRAVRLTEAGRRLRPHAERILADVTEAQAALGDLQTARAATIRLGTSTGLGARLDAILHQFSTRMPAAGLELVTATSTDRIRRVRSGDLDAAVLRGLPNDHTDVKLIPLWRDPLVAAIPAHHALAAREAVELAALARLPLRLASRARNPQLHELVVGCCQEAGFTPTFAEEFTTDQDTLAAIGFGPPSWTVYYAPQTIQIASPGVVFRPLRNPEPAMTTYLAVQPDPPRAELRGLIEACHAASRPLPPAEPENGTASNS
jgi:DNA-binding transcriptional LysR family regulator